MRERDEGDKLSLTLTNLDIYHPKTERIFATIKDPLYGLIDVDFVDGDLENIREGQTIGLATGLEYSPGEIQTLPHFIAGGQQFAYFSPDDLNYYDRHDNLTVAPENIRNFALQYGRIAVNDAVIFEFAPQDTPD